MGKYYRTTLTVIIIQPTYFKSDEKTLYFVSDMPGTIGLSDLFKTQINDDGTFGTPVNLGNSINTEGRDISICK
jgi:hypothetical protein